MAFETFDLGRIMQTAEAIKGMKRQAETDKLRDAYLQTQTTGAQQAQQYQAAQMDAATARQHFLANQAIETAQDPVAAAMQFAPENITDFDAAHGQGAFSRLSPEQVKQIAGFAKQKAAAAAGINLQPDANVTAQQGFAREMDTTNFGQQQQLAKEQHGYRMQETAAANAAKPGRSIRAMSPEEITKAGLPPGTAAQIDETTGKIDVLTKRDTTGVLSQKDATTAKIKLNTIQIAKKQLADIREAYDEGRKGPMNAFGPGQGMLPTQQGKLFDARVNRMRGTLTSLTRTPGVGSMSDYETKIDQSKFPDRNAWESVTADTIQGLEDQLSLLENGYTGLLSNGNQSAPEAPAGPAPAAGGWSVKRVK